VATFVLVHGAFHGGWCWERLIPLLVARGHTVLAPTLPAVDTSKTAPESVVKAWGRFVANVVSQQSRGIILVGHSRGGIVISQAAHEVPDKIAGLVYLTATLIPAGRSIQDVNDTIGAGIVPELELERTADGESLLCPQDQLTPMFYGRTSPEWVDRVRTSISPEPIGAFLAPVEFSEAARAIPRAYIECTDDRILPLAYQRRMQRALPCSPVLSIDSDHSPFFSAPEALADALEDIAQAFGGTS
jgi:pimeloyl-ACP methyl ester carboxylesterase